MDNRIYRYGWWIAAVKFLRQRACRTLPARLTPASPGMAGAIRCASIPTSKNWKRAIEQATRSSRAAEGRRNASYRRASAGNRSRDPGGPPCRAACVIIPELLPAGSALMELF